jgi:hypothetical protein
MTIADWAMLIATILGIASTLVMGLRWLVKSFLYELKPNGGSSMKDKVNVLEEKVDLLTELVKEALRR